MMKVKIRKARREDAKSILKILNESKNLRGNDKVRHEFELGDIIDYINNKLDKVFVYELDKKVVGVFIAQFWKTYIHLHSIAVDSKYQGKGVGKSLINFLEHLAKKPKRYLITAFTGINNKKMISIFKKRGYKRGKKFIFFSKKLK